MPVQTWLRGYVIIIIIIIFIVTMIIVVITCLQKSWIIVEHKGDMDSR